MPHARIACTALICSGECFFSSLAGVEAVRFVAVEDEVDADEDLPLGWSAKAFSAFAKNAVASSVENKEMDFLVSLTADA